MTAPLTREERPRRDEEAPDASRAPKASTTARKRHPCPTCHATGEVRRSFGFAYPGDPETEAWMMAPCETCLGSGAQPFGWVRPGPVGVRMPDRHFRMLPSAWRVIGRPPRIVIDEDAFRMGVLAKVAPSIAQAGSIQRGFGSPTIVSLEEFKLELARETFSESDHAMDALGYMAGPTARYFL